MMEEMDIQAVAVDQTMQLVAEAVLVQLVEMAHLLLVVLVVLVHHLQLLVRQ
jgi:hypothetical protein